MITMPNQIDFIPVLNIIPQPIYPAIYLPGIVHPFISYNFVNYPQCGNFSQYNESYDQSLPQSQALPPGLASPEDDIFYFHDFFFSKDDPPLESYRDTISATGSFENTTKIQQQSPELSFLALSIMNSIWNDQQHSDAWEEFSIYKAGSIHQNQWRSLLTEIAQDQTKLIPSDQMSKVINNLLESSSQRSRFQKYCKSKSVHSILENYEEYELWRELESVLKDDQSDLTLNLKSNQGETENSEFVEIQITVSENDKHEQKLVESQKLKQEQLESSKQILIETKCNNSVLPVELQVEVASANVIVNKEEKDSSKSCFVQDEYIVSTKENNKNDINRSRRNKKNSRKIKSIKSYSNEIESLPSDSDQINKQQENKEIQDQGSVKLQSYKEFEEDRNIAVSSAENIKTVDDEERNPEKVQENIKTKKSKKNRKRKGNKKAAATSLRVEDHSKAIPENNLATASNIPNDSLSAHIEKLLALTLNQENENEFRLATHGNGNKDKLDETPKDEEEKDFVVTKDCHIDMSKDFIKQNHNSTLTGETSAKTETDISTEYEEYKKDGSNHKVSKISKDQKPQFNQIIKVDSEDRQNDIIQSPRSMSNAENEYYMDMISNILSEDPSALERLKEMLLSHSINLGLPAAGFTEEEIQEIEEVNMELEKVMKRRFKDNFAEEDENPLLQQEDKSRRNRPYVQEHDLVGLSNELVSLSALLCDDFDDATLQKNNEIDSNVLGIPFDTISYLEELMRNRAEFMEELQSGTKNA